MSEKDLLGNRRKTENPESRSDTQGNDEPIDMEDDEEEETSRKVNEDRGEPDAADEEADEKID